LIFEFYDPMAFTVDFFIVGQMIYLHIVAKLVDNW